MSDLMSGGGQYGSDEERKRAMASGENQQGDPMKRLDILSKKPEVVEKYGGIIEPFKSLAQMADPALTPMINTILDVMEGVGNWKGTGRDRTSAQGPAEAASQFGGRGESLLR